MIFYSLWARTFFKADQDHLASTGQKAGKALGEELEDESEKMEEDDEDDNEEGDVNAVCLYCRERGRRDKHWISECRRMDSNSKSELTNKNKNNNKEHYCKTFFSRNNKKQLKYLKIITNLK